MTTEEQQDLQKIPEAQRWSALLLRFSLKEAVYKALHPFVQRYVTFTELSLWPQDNGDCQVELRLPRDEGQFDIETRWLRTKNILLTTCRLRRKRVKHP